VKIIPCIWSCASSQWCEQLFHSAAAGLHTVYTGNEEEPT